MPPKKVNQPVADKKEEKPILRRSLRLQTKPVEIIKESTNESFYEEEKKPKTKRTPKRVKKEVQDEDWEEDSKQRPILTQKTIDALTGSFRRQPSKPSTSGRKRAPSKKKTAKKDDEDLMEVDGEAHDDEETKPKKNVRKRKLDATDLECENFKQNKQRATYNQNEKNMMVFIRSLSHFLNPVHRFWLNPTVMRDIMHMYFPESRSKTVSSIMAASAREMLKPGRITQSQYILKVLTEDEKMIKIRDENATKCKTEKDKDSLFWTAFNTAYKLVYENEDEEEIPSVEADDEAFETYLEENELDVTLADPIKLGLTRRSRKPETIKDIQHCVTYNIIISKLISDLCDENTDDEEEQESKSVTKSQNKHLINKVAPTVVDETLSICFSDGLLSRNKYNESKKVTGKHQINAYFRRFFNHQFRKDLFDLLKDVLLVSKHEDQVYPTNEDNPAALLHMIDFQYLGINWLNINFSNVTGIIDCSGFKTEETAGDELKKQASSRGKNVENLKKAPLRLENVDIEFPHSDVSEVSVPRREDVLPLIYPVFECVTIDDPTDLLKQLELQINSLKINTNIFDAMAILEEIRSTGIHGATFDDLLEKSALSLNDLENLLYLFSQLSIAFPCGVDVKRYVVVEHCSSWFVKTDTHRYGFRPWMLPDGSMNWSALRWMAESLFMTIFAKPGLLLEELILNYSVVLSPVLIHELIDFLITLGCCVFKVSKVSSVKLSSPFPTAEPPTVESIASLEMTPDAWNKFSIFFMDVTLPEKLLNRK